MLSEVYKNLYNYLYSSGISSNSDYRLNHIGWNSAFDGQPYSSDVMTEWRNDTCSQIMLLPHKKIFEIGCGTGMLLFSLLNDTDFYYGIDISQKAIEYIETHLSEEEKSKIHLEVMDASDIDEFDVDDCNLAIINSASQYMGGEKNYRGIISNLADKLRPGGRIFLGDLKSAALKKLFYKTVELWDKCEEDLEDRITRREKNDQEFYISLDYLESMKKYIPRIKKVVLYTKQGRECSEMNIFRYNAVLYLDEYNECDYKKIDITNMSIEETEKVLINATDSYIVLTGYNNRHLYDVCKKNNMDISETKSTFYPGEICALAHKCGFNAHSVTNSDELWNYNIYCEKR